MTIGVDAEYFLPADREPKNYRKLSREVLTMIDMARVQIADGDSTERMHDVVQNVNDVFKQDGILGVSAVLESEFTIVLSRGVELDENAIREIDVHEIATSSQVEGVFVGCDVVMRNGSTPELVYVVELPMITQGKSPFEALRVRTAIAAVDEGTLSVDTEVSGTGESLELLDGVESEFIAKKLRYLDELKAAADEVDADLLREMGLVATEVLAQPEVAKSKALRSAITELCSSVLNGSTWYVLEGFEVRKATLDGRGSFSINTISAAGYIDKVVTIEDFEYVPEANGKSADAVMAKTLQPALFMKEGEDEYIIPIKYLTLFYSTVAPSEADSCDSARTRFLEEYPNVFAPKSHKLRRSIWHIIEKYSQNDGGSV